MRPWAAGARAYGASEGADMIGATHVDADPDAPDRIEWDNGVYVASHDPLWTVSRDALGVTDAQMDAFLA
jgi:hypothetical protein